MDNSKKSADERIQALEKSVNQMTQLLAQFGQGVNAPLSSPRVNFALHEQTLGLLRSLYWQEATRERYDAPVSLLCDKVCSTVTLRDSNIKAGHTGRIEDTPLGCVRLRAVVVDDGIAEFTVCCQGSDCVVEVAFIVHPQGQPDTRVYEEARTITCFRDSGRAV